MIPLINNTSLLSLIQNLEHPPKSFLISASTVPLTINCLTDFLVEQQIPIDLWLKLPPLQDWLEDLQLLKNQANTQQIYLCDSDASQLDDSLIASVNSNGTTPMVQVPLKAFKQDFFLLFTSEFLSGLIWLTAKTGNARRAYQQKQYKLIYTFEPEVVYTVWQAVKAASVVPTDQWPVPDNSASIQTKLFSRLLGQYIEQIETLKQDKPEIPLVQSQNEQKSFQLEDQFWRQLVREMRSPITHMKTALSLLSSKQLKKSQRELYLNLLQRECERQNALVGRLLKLVEIDEEDNSSNFSPTQIDNLVPGVVSTYQPLASEKGIALGYKIAPHLPLVSCPSDHVKQIIIQLIENSLQFTAKGGKVFVQVHWKSPYIVLTISDNGQGIATVEIPKIFHSFYRGKNASNSAAAGLGLTIVQHLLQRCGGSISVHSKLDVGTTFRVLLPAVS